jgi:acetyl esterase/lipase
MVRVLLFSLFMSLTFICNGQTEFSLYLGKIPNSIQSQEKEEIVYNPEVDTLIYKVSNPTLTVYLPSKEKASGAAVIICPGGGYHVLLINREGRNIAREFNKRGVAAFVLKYRLPENKIMPDKSIGPLQDAQRAIQIIRQRAGEWYVDPNMIGIMGFSAGGHLAATAGTHFDKAVIDNPKGTSLRPDFMILIYPVISFMDSVGHIGSREFLLGKSPTEREIRFFSNEYQVTKSTPPAFLTLAGDDTVVPIANSLLFYNALKKNSVPAELHLYSAGEHGFLKQPPFDEWFGRCCYWMKTNGWIL